MVSDIAASSVDRDDAFPATKRDGETRSMRAVRRSVRASLDRLDTDHRDLLMIHRPHDGPPFSPVGRPGAPPVAGTLSGTNDLVEAGLVRHLGVSNVGIRRLHGARLRSDAPIRVDQVQFNPYWDQRDLPSYCRRNDVLLTAYGPLCHGDVRGDGAIEAVGRRHGKSAAQIAIRWAIQHEGVVAVPKTTTRAHLAANGGVFDFESPEAEMERIRRPSKLRAATGFVRDRPAG